MELSRFSELKFFYCHLCCEISRILFSYVGSCFGFASGSSYSSVLYLVERLVSCVSHHQSFGGLGHFRHLCCRVRPLFCLLSQGRNPNFGEVAMASPDVKYSFISYLPFMILYIYTYDILLPKLAYNLVCIFLFL